jgi:serine/threonine-protein kinase
MVTGKRPHRAESLAELGAERSRLPDDPSSLTDDVDPALERVILRCLEPESTQRPTSAVAVAAALPGGDPLAAALEAGETPSPDMVAAAGEEGRLRPAVAWGLLVGVAAALAVMLLISPRYYLVNQVPLPKQPAVLEDRAVEIVQALGYEAEPADRASRLSYDRTYLDWVSENDSSLSRWEALQQAPPAMLFWYRQSPEHMGPIRIGRINTSYDDPPPLIPGMVRLRLDPSGRLQQFEAVPAQIDSALANGRGEASRAATPSEEEAQILFDLAGLDRERFVAADPLWVPPHYCDTRAAWTGHYPERDVPLRIEAGWLSGQLVYFDLVGPWQRPHESAMSRRSLLQRIGGMISTVLILCLLTGGVLVARNHMRAGRGDRRGATRLAVFILSLQMLVWLFVANHAPSLEEEFEQFLLTLALIFFVAALFWVVYLALEPYMRRNWPDLIISWARILGGRLRDPLVCRDILIGVLAGTLITLLDSLNHFLPGWLDIAPRYPYLSMILGSPSVLNGVVGAMAILADSIFSPLAIVFLLLGLRWLVRSPWLAAAIVILAVGFIAGTQSDPGGVQSQVSMPLGILLVGLYVFVVMRFGLLALVTLAFVTRLLESAWITTDFSRWYASNGIVTLALTMGLALYCMANAMGGKPLRRP